MMRRALLVLGLLAHLLARPADAWLAQGTTTTPTYQVFVTSLLSTADATNDSFIPVNFGAQSLTTDGIFTVFPVAGTISTMHVKVNGTNPTSTKTWDITLRKNGSDTAMTCQIGSASSGVCTSTTNISFAAGDYGSIKFHPSNTPTVTRLQVALLFQPTAANDTMISMFGNGFSTSATQSQIPYNSYSVGSVANRRYGNFADSGTIDRFYVASNAPGTAASGKSYAYTVVRDGSAQTTTCTISDDATTCNDTSHSVSITGTSGTTIGHDVVVQAVPTSTPTSAVAGMAFRYLPTTAGSFLMTYTAPSAVDHATSTYYFPMVGGNSGGTTTESNMQQRVLSMTVTKIAVELAVAPGAGKSRAFTLRKNGSDTALTCTVSDTNTACTATGSISVADDDLLVTSDVPTGSPATTNLSISYLANH